MRANGRSRRPLALAALLAIANLCTNSGCDEPGARPPARDSSVDGSSSGDGAGGDGRAADGEATGDGAAARWETAEPLPTARQQSTVVALDGRLFVIGGIDAKRSTTSDVSVYDPSLGRWSAAADLPVAMHSANAAVAGSKIYVLGSLDASRAADERCYVYDPDRDAWISRRAMLPGRARGASATGAIGSKIYVAGGFSGGQAVKRVGVYDTVSDRWLPLADMPVALDHPAAGVIGAKLYVAGGRVGPADAYSDTTYVFTPGPRTWIRKQSMPVSRGDAAAAVLGHALYVFGGEGNNGAQSGVFAVSARYSPASDRWEKLAPMKTPRHGLGAGAIGGRIYLPGGATRQGFSAVATHEVFVP